MYYLVCNLFAGFLLLVEKCTSCLFCVSCGGCLTWINKTNNLDEPDFSLYTSSALGGLRKLKVWFAFFWSHSVSLYFFRCSWIFFWTSSAARSVFLLHLSSQCADFMSQLQYCYSSLHLIRDTYSFCYPWEEQNIVSWLMNVMDLWLDPCFLLLL